MSAQRVLDQAVQDEDREKRQDFPEFSCDVLPHDLILDVRVDPTPARRHVIVEPDDVETQHDNRENR